MLISILSFKKEKEAREAELTSPISSMKQHFVINIVEESILQDWKTN